MHISRLEKSEEFLKTLMDYVHSGIAVIDQDYSVVKVNKAFVDIFEVQEEDLIGKKLSEVLVFDEQFLGVQSDTEIDIKSLGDLRARLDKVLYYHSVVLKEQVSLKIAIGVGLVRKFFRFSLVPVNHEGHTYAMAIMDDVTDLMDQTRTMEDLLTRDPLTGVYNPYFIQSKLEDHMGLSKLYSENLTVAALGIDDLAKVQAEWDYDEAERVIRDVAGFLQRMIRGVDLVGRIGRDQFLIVMPKTDQKEGESALEKIKTAVKDEQSLPIRLTGGAVSYDGVEDVDALVERAVRLIHRLET